MSYRKLLRSISSKERLVVLLSMPGLIGMGGAEAQAATSPSLGHPFVFIRHKRLPGQNPIGTGAKTDIADTLATLLTQVTWNRNERGPLLVVDPDHTLRLKDSPLSSSGGAGEELRTKLTAFHRTLFPVGTLTVIAPTEMVQIEARPPASPNLYTSLPRELKVKYLLATLTAEQWKQLGSQGLGSSDLTAEQRAVYNSLLPEPFQINRFQRGEDGKLKAATETILLTPEQRAQVRLRVHRNVDISIEIVNKPGVYVSADSARRSEQANPILLRRNTETDEQASALFGVDLSATVPNKLKPGQLDYASTRLDTPVALEGAAKIGDLINWVGKATRLEIYADPRVALLPITVQGSRARAGDILKALALAVTGTYRKVDTAFVLTSDLIGLGTRQLQLAEWEGQLYTSVDMLKKEMTQKISLSAKQGGGIQSLGFAPGDPYALPEALDKEVQKRLNSKNRDFPVQELTPEIRSLLRTSAEGYAKYNPGDSFREDAARLKISWHFGFQLPDGTLLPDEETPVMSNEDLLPNDAKPFLPAPAVRPHPFVAGPLPRWAKDRMLFLTPHSAEEASKAVGRAQRLGFTELVLQTEEASVLRAAITEGEAKDKEDKKKLRPLKVYASVEPFSLPSGVNPAGSILDRNLLNETAVEVANANRKSSRWQIFVQQTVQFSYPNPIPEIINGGNNRVLAPGGAGMAERLVTLARLAALEGLSGLFFCNTQPNGYAGKRPEQGMKNFDTVGMAERGSLGYTPPLRLAFLRSEGVDPIDLIPHDLRLSIDLPQPFFPAEETSRLLWLRSPGEIKTAINHATDSWDLFRANENRKAMHNLYTTLHAIKPDLPLYLEARPEWNNDATATRYWLSYARWMQSDQMLIATQELSGLGSGTLPGSEIRFLRPTPFSASEMVPARARLEEALESFSPKPATFKSPSPGPAQSPPLSPKPATSAASPTVAFDFRYLPVDSVFALLEKCISPDEH